MYLNYNHIKSMSLIFQSCNFIMIENCDVFNASFMHFKVKKIISNNFQFSAVKSLLTVHRKTREIHHCNLSLTLIVCSTNNNNNKWITLNVYNVYLFSSEKELPLNRGILNQIKSLKYGQEFFFIYQHFLITYYLILA